MSDLNPPNHPHILDLIEAAAAAHPHRPAITLKAQTLTYRELATGIDSVARHAVAAGAMPGDRFLYAAKPSPVSIMVTLGLLRAGLTLVFVDPFSSPQLFATRAAMVEPRYTLADSLLYLLGHRALEPIRRWKNASICDYGAVDAGHLYLGRRLPGLPRGATPMSGWLKNAPDAEPPVLDGAADAVITFTSGTTSDPRGVIHSLGTLSANMANFAGLVDVAPGQKVYSEPMTVGMVALCYGAEWHIPAPGERIPDCDLLFAVPTEVLAALASIEAGVAEGHRLPRIRTVATGAAPVLPSLVDHISRVLGEDTTILSVYGMTEMLPIAVCDARQKALVPRGDLLGTPVGDTEVSFAHDQEILVRGPGLMKHYFGKPREEWHPTGDLGELDERGRLIMLGRKKNMFIRGNMNIYPSLYEPGISTIAGVADAVLVGVDDEYGNDRIVLFVTADAGTDRSVVRARVEREAARHMDVDALPDQVVVLEAIPTTGRALKRDTAALAGLARRLFADAQ